MTIENVFVVGAGFMGHGIAQVSAMAGYRVTLCDVSEECLRSAMDNIRASLEKLASKGKVDEGQASRALGLIDVTTSLDQASGADIVVEAVPERISLKEEVFRALDRVCQPHAILGTNTSAIPISSIAATTSHPERVVGIHFFGPVPLMRLVEIIRGLLTSDETMAAADNWARSLGKETVLVNRDHAGFVANRVNIPSSIEAARMVDEGLATPEEIDRATGGFEAGVGPLQIMDNAGLDVSFNAAMAIYEDTRDPKFLPPPLMRRMVAAGLLGRKSGRGFYDYSSGKREGYITASRSGESPDGGAGRSAALLQRFLMPGILEAVRVVEAGVATAEDVDKATRLGFNLPLGQLEMADGFGLDEIQREAERLYGETGDPKFYPPPLLRRMTAAGLLGRKSGRGFHSYP
ncbi:MAG: 3-hydroxyacyl-CoA dehydrogenase [Actinobacteria bacterium]|nr:3-hydroxyacyl-CoA dehydrogenase [Actinomycetota bacterium]